MHQSVATVAKDLPQLSHSREERLRQCLIMAGAENLPDSELLEVILFTSNRGKNVEPLVEKLNADGEALTGAGLNSSAIAGIKFIREAALRLLRSELRDRPIVNSWDKLIDYCNAQIAYSKVGEFHIFFLDRKNALIKDERQQRGTVGYTLVCTREVIRRALDLGAAALILVHNHPSGDPTPSPADVKTTKDISKAASVFDISVHDHLIIGHGRYVSLRDLGLI